MRFDPEVAKAVRERTAEVPEKITESGDASEAVASALWGQWLDLGQTLQTLGVSPHDMCDAANAISEEHNSLAAERGEATRR